MVKTPHSATDASPRELSAVPAGGMLASAVGISGLEELRPTNDGKLLNPPELFLEGYTVESTIKKDPVGQ